MTAIVVLGSAQDGGLPQLGANHRHDRSARLGAIPPRLAASAAIVDDHGRVLLLDASPDLRHQEHILRQWPALAHRPPGAPFDGIVLTHGHMGHYAGLVHLGREAAAAEGLPCWVTESMAALLTSNEPWRSLVTSGHLELRLVEPGRTFEPWDGLELAAIPVPHRAELTDTIAVSVPGRLLYLPDIDGWDLWPDAEPCVTSHRIALLDGTFWSHDELPAGRMDVVGHPAAVDTIARFGRSTTRVVLTHLNHTNPLVDPGSAASAAAAEAGVLVAHDGLTLDI